MTMRYPVTGPASIIECPRHGLAVALDDEGRIVSQCPSCVRAAMLAEEKLAAMVGQRRVEAESWNTSA